LACRPVAAAYEPLLIAAGVTLSWIVPIFTSSHLRKFRPSPLLRGILGASGSNTLNLSINQAIVSKKQEINENCGNAVEFLSFDL
jgi:hypothetical protein